ncbi:OmpA family protein [Magnetococcales bacterium HHB-1]
MRYHAPEIRTETTESPFWISFADLMTALVMLFLVVMSISMVAVSSRSLVEKKAQETDIESILVGLDQAAKKRDLEIHINQTNHTISFGEKVRFAHNSYQLSKEAIKKLQDFVPLLLKVKASHEGQRWLKRVHIEGYTDETGTYLYNVHLSLNRAQAVVCALIATPLTQTQRNALRQMLIIDGASTTSIKSSPSESRRVEVRLEFRHLGEAIKPTYQPRVNMPLGRCAIGGTGASFIPPAPLPEIPEVPEKEAPQAEKTIEQKAEQAPEQTSKQAEESLDKNIIQSDVTPDMIILDSLQPAMIDTTTSQKKNAIEKHAKKTVQQILKKGTIPLPLPNPLKRQ